MILRSTSVASKARSSSSRSSWRVPVSGSTLSTCSPSLRNTPLMRTLDLTLHDVVVDQVALADGPLVLVAVDDVLEVGQVWAAGVAVRPILMASKWSSVLRQIDSSLAE